MLIAQRQYRLEELLAQRGISDLESLSTELNVSQSTIRRDIEILESRGLVKRTHGGVIWLGERSVNIPRPYAFDSRLTYQTEAKTKIAVAARSLVQPNQTILLDGGTTTFELAKTLIDLPLAIITNSLPIADLFLNNDNVELLLTGGLLYPKYGVLLGPHVEHMLNDLHPQTLFLSVGGIHAGTLYNQNLLLVQAEQKMMEQSQRIVLLADSTKFGQQSLVRLCQLDQIDTVVSDESLPEEYRQQIRNCGCELVIAK
ncbi:MAG TPA: DeoR/GlpR family DNA-binding transcription regulator [Tepidisphaeraceae bacterium]|jgi:DeoR/GlpR family transcriptional regulator of sugar metabolism